MLFLGWHSYKIGPFQTYTVDSQKIVECKFSEFTENLFLRFKLANLDCQLYT